MEKDGDVFSAWNMEMSFFGMPLYILDICPENRDESNGNSIVSSGCNSSRFSGPCTRSYVKGIPKKDIPMFLICIASA